MNESTTYFQLSNNHTQDAAVWSWLVILRCYTMRYFCEGETLAHTKKKKPHTQGECYHSCTRRKDNIHSKHPAKIQKGVGKSNVACLPAITVIQWLSHHWLHVNPAYSKKLPNKLTESFSTIALFPWNCCPSHVRHDASICEEQKEKHVIYL